MQQRQGLTSALPLKHLPVTGSLIFDVIEMLVKIPSCPVLTVFPLRLRNWYGSPALQILDRVQKKQQIQCAHGQELVEM